VFRLTFFARNSGSILVRRLIFSAVLLTVFSVLVACGSGSDGEDSTAAAPVSVVDEELAAVSGIFASELLFTLEDYVAAGWKKSKQFGTETVPEATDIWYGFYSGKDIEVRFYESHDIAKTLGFESASEVIDLDALSKVAPNKSGGSATTKYKAFAVVGNTVMLCELSVESCVALVGALGG
jgi:hypothetical protein